MVKVKRSLSIFLAVALSVSLFAGCGKSNTETAGSTTSVNSTSSESSTVATDKQVTIKMSNWIETEEATKVIYKKLIDDFSAKNPSIKVETIGLPFAQYKDQVLIAANSGNAADVIMGNSQMMVAFNGAKALEPLESLIKKETLEDFFANNLAGTTFKGKVMALPWAPHPNSMFWNKELFKQAGLDPEKAPATWEEMLDAAKKVAALKKDKDGNQIFGIGHANAKESHAGTMTIGLLYAFGGQFEKDGKIVLDSPETIETMKYLKDLASSGVMPTSTVQKDLRSLFASGRLGIYFDGDMGRGTLRTLSGKGKEFDKLMGVSTIPTNKTGKSETVYTEHELGIAATSTAKEAAASLIEYLVGREAMVNYHQAFGTLSARKSIATLPEMNEDDYMKVFNKQSETSRPLPASNPMFDKACLEIIKGVERITLNNEDIPKVVTDVQKAVEDLYKN